MSEYYVQHATCPVAVLREASRLHDHERRIIVGVDGSRSSKAALRWAIRQASIAGMFVEAITAWSIPTYYGYSLFAGGSESAGPAGVARGVVTKATDELGEIDADIRITSRVIHGDAAQLLAEALLGSVSQRCVHHAMCPVVIVQDSPRHRA